MPFLFFFGAPLKIHIKLYTGMHLGWPEKGRLAAKTADVSIRHKHLCDRKYIVVILSVEIENQWKCSGWKNTINFY